MNICMLAYSFYDYDNRIRRYAEALSSRGDNVDVIALNHNSKNSFEVLNGVNVYRIQKRTVDEKGKFSYFIKIFLFLINSTFFVTKLHFFKKKYNLIHVHSIPDFEVFATIIPKLFGTKIILDIHDIVPELYASKFNKDKNSYTVKFLLLIEKFSIMFSNHVIIANHIWEKTLLSRSVKKEKLSVFLNYPDKRYFVKTMNTKNDKNFIKIVYPGTLSWHQGIDIVLKALDKIRDNPLKFEFYIYGEGKEKPNLIKLSNNLNLTQIVFIKDMVPLEDVPKVIYDADIGIVPKRKEDSFGNEAFSTKTLEFMSLGIPVLVSDTNIDKYYFQDNQVQFFKSGDVDDLAEKLILLMDNKELRGTLVNNSFKLLETFNWDVHKLRYFEIVDKLCENN
jgi:glycosyltransferase involved in cell wall biosynthesis